MGFRDKLRDSLKGKLSEDTLTLLPRGFQTLGKVIIIKLNQKLLEKKELIGKAYLELLPRIKAVYLNKGKIVGEFREPEKIEFIAGEDNPIVEHKEHGIVYQFDITKIMFSKGNINERKYLATLIKDGEIIVDMFAGIGYFSLPIAKHASPVKVYSIEINPVSYKFLVKNIKINHVEDIVTPIFGDSKKEILTLSKSGVRADRVIMGVLPAPKAFIKEALSLTKDKGSIYHYEGIANKEEFMSLFEEFNEVAKTIEYKTKLKDNRVIKSYGPKLYHIVLDIVVYKE